MKPQIFDKRQLLSDYGGIWCNCIDKIVDEITPMKIAGYCIAKGYKPHHPPQQDEYAIRYGYYLTTEVELVQNGDGTEIERPRKIVAIFGEFEHRPYETLKSCLEAILALSYFEKRVAQQVAEDIIKADESLVPEPDQKGLAPGQQQQFSFPGRQRRSPLDFNI